MTPAYQRGLVSVWRGHVLDVLAALPAESVQTVVTSPPYYGLRAYSGLEPQVWGGAADCEHDWQHGGMRRKGGARHSALLDGRDLTGHQSAQVYHLGDTCTRCGAWRGHLGLEPLLDCLAWARGEPPCAVCYVCHLRRVCAALRHVLRPDGVLWLNLGDSYAGSGRGPTGWNGIGDQARRQGFACWDGAVPPGLKPKDLLGIPWRIALALQADGWWLRADVVWAKPNSLPEPVGDRPTHSHEYVLLLSRSRSYFYDQHAVREPPSETSRGSSPLAVRAVPNPAVKQVAVQEGVRASTLGLSAGPEGPNLRSVWTIATEPLRDEHYAAYPSALVKRCVALGTSEHGACAACGAPWARVVERKPMVIARSDRRNRLGEFGRTQPSGTVLSPPEAKTLAWRPTCRCGTDERVPCTVLDPFVGSGTTALVAERMGRRAWGIELSADYLALIARRLAQPTLDGAVAEATG